MSAHEILIAVMAVFAALGAIDRITGNRFGLGQEFENGILAMGSLAMAMIGIICLAPVLAAVLRPESTRRTWPGPRRGSRTPARSPA